LRKGIKRRNLALEEGVLVGADALDAQVAPHPADEPPNPQPCHLGLGEFPQFFRVVQIRRDPEFG
jgi:hypothetical protein